MKKYIVAFSMLLICLGANADMINNISVDFLKDWNLQVHYQSIKEMNSVLEKKFGESTNGYMQRVMSTIELFNGNKTYREQIIFTINNMMSGFSFSQEHPLELLREQLVNQFFGGSYLEPSMYEFAKENSTVLALVHTTHLDWLDANNDTYERYEKIYRPILGESFGGYKKRTLEEAQSLLNQ